MTIAALPANEQDRLKAINEYYILDTLPEADFDDITRLASDICHTPISLVSIIDAHRQWFKSRHGLEKSEITRNYAFCAHAINSPNDVLVVEDLSADDRFYDNPLVTNDPKVVFYAGIPLVTPEGYAIGTLSVWDVKPRKLDDGQIKNLKSLARQIVTQMELRKTITLLNQKNAELKRSYSDLEQFSYIASHDLKSPLNNIISLTHLLKDGYASKLDAEGNEYISFLNDAAYQLSDLISEILRYSMSSHLLVDEKERINVASLIEEVKGLIKVPENCTISYENADKDIYSSRIALKQILLNLLQNAIKFDDKKQIHIDVRFSEDKDTYTFEVKDNGAGIAPEDQDKIFDLFETLSNKNKNKDSTGIGLAVVKRLVEKLSGTIKVYSELSKGAAFIFSIPK